MTICTQLGHRVWGEGSFSDHVLVKLWQWKTPDQNQNEKMMSTTTLPSESEIGLIHPFAVSPDSMATVKKESWNEIVNELNQLRALQDDWDGQGADAPTAANLDIALAWIERMRCWPSALPPTKVVPGVTGEVYLVWQHASLYLEAEIDGDREVEWLLSETEKPARQWKTDLDGTWMVGVVH